MENSNDSNVQLVGVLSNIASEKNSNQQTMGAEDSIQSVDAAHKDDLARTRRIIGSYFRIIEQNIGKPPSKEMPRGEKETAISVLAKLSQILIRIIPLERAISGMKDVVPFTPDEDPDANLLSKDDMEILSEYVLRQAELKK